MRTKRMASTVVLDPTLRIKPTKKTTPIFNNNNNDSVVEEIEGLIRVYKDGKVERPPIVPYVDASVLSPDLPVTSRDVVIDKYMNIWARFYAPFSVTPQLAHTHDINNNKHPLLVYFHGGGFCVGSASWSCYHEFLSKLSSKLGCLIMSVNYRLAPENRLPAAYEDGFKSLTWLKQQATTTTTTTNECYWWSRRCDFSRIFLIGDSAGANIVQHLATSLASCNPGSDAKRLQPLTFRGTVLIQPFFGGEARTFSEKHVAQSPRSALSLPASDTYWRLALPAGVDRDHPWCNPTANSESLRHDLPVMVCVSETDILRDRNLEFCAALSKAGKRVEYKVYGGVGHAFQILSKSQLSQMRSNEMMAHIKAFISSRC
ncbi:hypothetical protein TIFTF001_008025 [Ficus carica]|uniref:Alpha/beta hydrolase fold-3 domain-containing protein n=1 Tax=Ficus carica TaxID=3494 RepID=A0AA87ZRE7_FICCA|nr:hypothetical protein TIFTF001_008025 [Ficus carica]